jgi:hypothetical protein
MIVGAGEKIKRLALRDCCESWVWPKERVAPTFHSPIDPTRLRCEATRLKLMWLR